MAHTKAKKLLDDAIGARKEGEQCINESSLKEELAIAAKRELNSLSGATARKALDAYES